MQRLHQAFFLKIREPVPELEIGKVDPLNEITGAKSAAGRLELRRKDPRFWPAAGVVLDILAATEARVADTSKLLEISTGNLIDFLRTDSKVWEEANHLRQKFGHKQLAI